MDYINTYSKLRLLYNFKRSINVIIYLVQANISNFFVKIDFIKQNLVRRVVLFYTFQISNAYLNRI